MATIYEDVLNDIADYFSDIDNRQQYYICCESAILKDMLIDQYDDILIVFGRDMSTKYEIHPMTPEIIAHCLEIYQVMFNFELKNATQEYHEAVNKIEKRYNENLKYLSQFQYQVLNQ